MPVDVGLATWGPMTDRGPGEPTGSRAFVVACGLGFDARVMAGATPELKRQLGFGAYLISAARQAARLRPVDFRIEADGVVHEFRGLIVLLANCGQIVPRLVGPRRPIDPTDGFLEVIVIRASGRTGGLVGLAEVLVHDSGPARTTRSVRLRARSVRVTADPPEPAQVDGDHHEADWLAAECVPAGLRSSGRDPRPARLARPMTDEPAPAPDGRRPLGVIVIAMVQFGRAALIATQLLEFNPFPDQDWFHAAVQLAGAGRRDGRIRRLADHRRSGCSPRA